MLRECLSSRSCHVREYASTGTPLLAFTAGGFVALAGWFVLVELPSRDNGPVRVEGDLVPDSVVRQESPCQYRFSVEKAAQEMREETRVLTAELVAQGLTVRDIGELLGISYQRVQLIIKGE